MPVRRHAQTPPTLHPTATRRPRTRRSISAAAALLVAMGAALALPLRAHAASNGSVDVPELVDRAGDAP